VARFYRLVRLVIDLLLRGGRDRSKREVEILVLRHQLAVLQRHIARSRSHPTTALSSPHSRVLGRDRCAIFMVKPDTLLRWHRRLVGNHWTSRHRPCRPSTTVETGRAILRFA
jgi:putative transposase